ncbi:hypothetical protein [Roseibium aggregatum]|uniref:Uncharacterized protein n=1 Tax=Roseibium aggregatum TaxID=187304 RepID=A0A0M6Y6J9_9HYPH|nr:hypothetical protein [Roseibium aggregatum]CTQ45725.1 hypothetical protein LAL4801_04180 [Roseibium aggregatum]
MTDFSKRYPEEAKTYELFAEYLTNRDYTPVEYAISQAFRAQFFAALPIERIKKIGDALSGIEPSENDYAKAITCLIRAKVLRRNAKNKTLIEVNF